MSLVLESMTQHFHPALPPGGASALITNVARRPRTPPPPSPRRPGAADDRQMLFPVLSCCLGWIEGAAAVEAVLAVHGSFAEAVAAPYDDLRSIPALGGAGAAALKAIHAAALQLAFVRLKQGPVLRNMTGLLDYLQASSARGSTEQLRALFLDPKNRLIADETMGEGDVRGVAVFPGRVLRRALALHASALILVHNHPSGDATPSEADIEMTLRLQRAASEMDISLHDHIIVTGEGHSSFKRLGLI